MVVVRMANKKPVSLRLMNVAQFDLNLLSVFCMVYDSGSISRVADLLDVSPSAVSQSLGRLKSQAGDYLFVRTGGQFRPTAYSDALYAQVSEHIGRIADAIPVGGKRPTRKSLLVRTSFFLSSLIIPLLYQCLLQAGAGLSLHHTESGLSEPLSRELLSQRHVDIIFSPTCIKYSGLISKKLLTTPMALVCSKRNDRYGDAISEAEFVQADMVGYMGVSERAIHYRQLLEKKYHPREKRLLTASVSAFLAAVAGTQSIGFFPRSMLLIWAQQAGLRELIPPFELPSFSVFATAREELLEEPTLVRLLEDLRIRLNEPALL